MNFCAAPCLTGYLLSAYATSFELSPRYKMWCHADFSPPSSNRKQHTQTWDSRYYSTRVTRLLHFASHIDNTDRVSARVINDFTTAYLEMYIYTAPAAAPVVASYPAMYGGLYNRWGRWGTGPGYGLGYNWYNPYGYVAGTYW